MVNDTKWVHFVFPKFINNNLCITHKHGTAHKIIHFKNQFHRYKSNISNTVLVKMLTSLL